MLRGIARHRRISKNFADGISGVLIGIEMQIKNIEIEFQYGKKNL
jgi:hypothetical protein